MERESERERGAGEKRSSRSGEFAHRRSRLFQPRADDGRLQADRDLFALETPCGITSVCRRSEEAMHDVRGGSIGMIFQEPMTSLNPVLTVGFQVSEALRRHRSLSDSEADREALRLFDLVRIPDARRRFDEYPHTFSGGMRQRVMIAIALACRPRLLIADEPTTALDVTIQAQILDLIRELQREIGMSVMFITHDMGVVAEVADRVAVMWRGRKVEEAPVSACSPLPNIPTRGGCSRRSPSSERSATRRCRDDSRMSISGGRKGSSARSTTRPRKGRASPTAGAIPFSRWPASPPVFRCAAACSGDRSATSTRSRTSPSACGRAKPSRWSARAAAESRRPGAPSWVWSRRRAVRSDSATRILSNSIVQRYAGCAAACRWSFRIPTAR